MTLNLLSVSLYFRSSIGVLSISQAAGIQIMAQRPRKAPVCMAVWAIM